MIDYACYPITYTVDPSIAATARQAFHQWTVLTYLPFVRVTDHGQVTVTVSWVKDEWAAYTMDDVIVIDPRWAHGDWTEPILAHEIGHILGIPHTTDPALLMTIGFGVDHVTAGDAALVKVTPCDPFGVLP
jgi:hypothetical protein